DVEEERRLCFVGMTRAKQELYLCHARLREFRGQTLYAVPSMFLEELPHEGVELVDVSASAGGTARAIDEWRSGGSAADEGWAEAGVKPRPRNESAQAAGSNPDAGAKYAEGMLVRHDSYGVGRITQVSGFGALRKLKIRFSAHGEKTFIADKVKLEILRRN